MYFPVVTKRLEIGSVTRLIDPISTKHQDTDKSKPKDWREEDKEEEEEEEVANTD